MADTLSTEFSRVNHRSGKVHQPKTDVLITEPRRQLQWKKVELNARKYFTYYPLKKHRSVTEWPSRATTVGSDENIFSGRKALLRPKQYSHITAAK